MLERKTPAKVAKSVFFEDFNDVDIYIEDTATGYRKIFKELLKKAFGDTVKIDQIFPVGSRKEVIDSCGKDQNKRERKRVYIVDGDLYLLCKEPDIGLKGLFILPRYCIENYLIQEGPILDVLYQESPELEKEQLQTSFGFKTWESHNEPLLSELFKIYGISKKTIPTEQTVSYKVSNLCSNNTGEICPVKIQNRITSLKTKVISKIGQDSFDKEYENLTQQIEQSSMSMLHYVSGKDYLLPLILQRIRKVIKLRADNINLKIRLAEKCDILDLVEIQKFVLQ